VRRPDPAAEENLLVDLAERGAAIERRHPWEVARASFFARLIERTGVGRNATSVLDVGAGDAWLATTLRATLPTDARLTCWDTNYREEDLADALARERVTLTMEEPDGRFDLVLMLDVVEHVEDDVSFVRHIVDDRLQPGGRVVVSVPAYQALFTDHDRALSHFRRYSPAQCRAVLDHAGLVVDVDGGLFQSLLAVRALQALAERAARRRKVRGHGAGADHPGEDQAGHGVGVGGWHGGSRLTRGVTSVLEAEGAAALALGTRGHRLPGLSYWAVCHAGGAG
jgi:SAM-dependent methyltransferase